jgi:HK97 family phage major capsid protein
MESRAAIQTVTTTGGGYTIPQGFADFLEVAEKYYNPFTAEQGFTIYRTDGGNDIPFPAINDTAVEAYQININTSAETSATALTFAQPITMKAYKFTSGMIQIPQELIEDSAFNIMQVTAELLGERMGRGKAKAFTTGAGTTAPHGISTIIKATSALRTLPASNTALTRDDFVNLMYSVDIAYRNKPSCKWMLNDAVLKVIALLSIGSNDDRPLWQPSMIVGVPSTIEGVPYIINNYMDSTLAKTNLSVIFGDMSKYLIRQVNDRRVRVLNERYGEFDQTGIVMWERFDGQLLDAGTNPIKGAYHNRT